MSACEPGACTAVQVGLEASVQLGGGSGDHSKHDRCSPATGVEKVILPVSLPLEVRQPPSLERGTAHQPRL